MPLEPIPNWKPICTHPEHNPPMDIPPGMQYRHRCPTCGVESVLMTPEITCGSDYNSRLDTKFGDWNKPMNISFFKVSK